MIQSDFGFISDQILGYRFWYLVKCNLRLAPVGIIEPIKSGMRDPKLGIGKQEEDDYFTAEENIQRRKLDIEVEETEEVARKREVCRLYK